METTVKNHCSINYSGTNFKFLDLVTSNLLKKKFHFFFNLPSLLFFNYTSASAKRFIVIILSLYLTNQLQAQISITNQTSYHKASFGSTYGALESGTIDNGGLITLFVQNFSSSADSLIEVKISKDGVYDNSHYSVIWPKVIPAGGTTAICLKGLASPFAEGDTVLLETTSASGFSAQQTFVNKTPGLRLANILPSHDMTSLWVYLRNDQSSDAVINSIDINELILSPGNPSLNLISGSSTIHAGEVSILKIQLPAGTLTPLKPLFVNVRYQDGSVNKNVSTFQRLLPSEFPIGTWHSPLAGANEEPGRKIIRKLAATSVFGPSDLSDMTDFMPEYYMRVVREADFSNAGNFDPNQAAQYVSQNSNNPVFHYWNVDDEPDLNNKPISEELIKNMTYWKSDANTPSYVNLASQKNYQRYGFFTDVVSMDHYSDDGPPNVIPFPFWYTVEGSVREAIEYTAQLKKNTEPKRMNTWCQLISTAFSNQAEPHVINFQFWSHVAEGAKGIHFFTAKPNHPAEYPQLWLESEKLVHQLNGIKNNCLFSEPYNGVTVNSGNVIAKSLAGADAMTIILLNNSIDYTSVNLVNHAWTSTISSVPFDIQFTVPEWIPLEQFYETDENGKLEITSITDLGSRTYRITGTINDRSRVFVIGKNDTEAPQPITQINVSDIQSPSNFTLSWYEPIDNFGVKGYYIQADGNIIDTVMGPIWESNNLVNGCLIDHVCIFPFDDARNVGDSISVTIDLSTFGSGAPIISLNPVSQTVTAGTSAIFSVTESGSSSTTYVWQVNSGDGVWTNLQNDSNHSGVYTSSLTVFGLPNFNTYQYRCVVSAGCTQISDTSDIAILTVNGDLSIADLLEKSLKIYPNPSNGSFNISNESNQEFVFVLEDNMGRIIKQPNKISPSVKQQITGFSSGVYQLIFEDVKGNKILKRIVII